MSNSEYVKDFKILVYCAVSKEKLESVSHYLELCRATMFI